MPYVSKERKVSRVITSKVILTGSCILEEGLQEILFLLVPSTFVLLDSRILVSNCKVIENVDASIQLGDTIENLQEVKRIVFTLGMNRFPTDINLTLPAGSILKIDTESSKGRIDYTLVFGL